MTDVEYASVAIGIPVDHSVRVRRKIRGEEILGEIQ